MPKLTESQVNPKKISKMKVKLASQVYSRSVAANMGYLSQKGIIPEECQETAEVLIFFDELFDSSNGSYVSYRKRSGKLLLGPLTPNLPHHNTGNRAKIVLKSMKFIDNSAKECDVPSITNWLLTIENIEILKNKLFNEYNIKSIWMRHFNQDPLENFFGSVRSHGHQNTSPSCAGFESAFVSLVINNLSSYHSPGSNCEKDSSSVFRYLNNLFFDNEQFSNTQVVTS